MWFLDQPDTIRHSLFEILNSIVPEISQAVFVETEVVPDFVQHGDENLVDEFLPRGTQPAKVFAEDQDSVRQGGGSLRGTLLVERNAHVDPEQIVGLFVLLEQRLVRPRPYFDQDVFEVGLEFVRQRVLCRLHGSVEIGVADVYHPDIPETADKSAHNAVQRQEYRP
jgi:hypothetical protein